MTRTVYIVDLDFLEEEPAVFADEKDAKRYAEARGAMYSDAVVCEGELARRMVEAAERDD